MTGDARPLSRNNRGPRSRTGKAAVALARFEHGLAGNEIVLPTADTPPFPLPASRFPLPPSTKG